MSIKRAKFVPLTLEGFQEPKGPAQMQRPGVSGGKRRRRGNPLLAPQSPEFCLQLRYM